MRRLRLTDAERRQVIEANLDLAARECANTRGREPHWPAAYRDDVAWLLERLDAAEKVKDAAVLAYQSAVRRVNPAAGLDAAAVAAENDAVRYANDGVGTLPAPCSGVGQSG